MPQSVSADVQMHRRGHVNSRAFVHVNNRLLDNKALHPLNRVDCQSQRCFSREGTACAIAALTSSLTSVTVFA